MIACALSVTCSLAKMLETWLRTVFGLRRPAISGLVRCGYGGEDLALGQLGEGLGRRPPRARRGEVAHQALGDGGPEDGLAAYDGPYSP